MRLHRDPFEPIMCVLEADSPLAEYRKITDEILNRMPDEDRYPRAPRKRFGLSFCFGWACISGFGRRIFASFASARAIISQRRNGVSKT